MSVSVASQLARDQPAGNVAMQGASTAHLEQFLILAKSAKGSAVIELIKQVLDSPHIFVFGELLDLPSIKEVSAASAAPTHPQYFQLLQIFAFGKYRDYLDRRKELPDLSPQACTKLRQLTIVSLAQETKHISYSKLLSELEIADVRQLEDLIIDVIYADIIRGKLDQKNKQLQVDSAIGRDVKPNETKDILRVLESWSNACEGVLANIETQIGRANQLKQNNAVLKANTIIEIANIKKTLVKNKVNGQNGKGNQTPSPSKKADRRDSTPKAQSEIDEAMDDSGGGRGIDPGMGKGGIESGRKKGGGGGKGKGSRGSMGGARKFW